MLNSIPSGERKVSKSNPNSPIWNWSWSCKKNNVEFTSAGTGYQDWFPIWRVLGRRCIELKLKSISSPSPYLKQNLFSFDEKYIESVEKMKPVSENPIKFFCRCCDSLSFGIPLRTAWDQFSVVPNIKTANYIFHPNQPFALRLGRSENRHYNTGEIFPEIVTSFHFFNPNQPVSQ